jgi:hypothetical protein
MNTKLISRLENWKFEQALQYIDKDTPETISIIIQVLSEEYGDCGWFMGNQGVIVSTTVRYLLIQLGIKEEDIS